MASEPEAIDVKPAIAEIRKAAQQLTKSLNALIAEFERDTTCTVFVEQVEVMDSRKVIVKAAI